MREILFGLRTGFATTLARPRHTLLIGFGFIIAGITLVVLLTIPAGLKRIAGRTGLADVAVVLPDGASSEGAGTLKADLVGVVGSLPGVAHDDAGEPMVAPQFVVDTRMRRIDGSTATVLVRGITPAFWRIVGRTVQMRSGSRFRAGHDELIAGVAAARGFVSLATGDNVTIHKRPWHVNGQFRAGGGFWESELWADMSALQSAYHAQGTATALWVELAAPRDYDAFKAALKKDPRTQGLHAFRQRSFYTMRTGFLRDLTNVATRVIAIALGVGAILAIVNALGMALDARRRDLAVLRAVGFRRSGLAVALVLEVLVIGVVCAGIAVLIGWLAVNGREVGSSTFTSAIQFRLRVDTPVVGWTVAYLLAIGFLASLWPIIRAVRAPLTKTLQDE